MQLHDEDITNHDSSLLISAICCVQYTINDGFVLSNTAQFVSVVSWHMLKVAKKKKKERQCERERILD